MNALSLVQLRKVYGDLVALDSVDLDVAEGDFFALLGPNGAGKSTLIGIVSSLVRKTSGTVSIFGHDIAESAEKARSMIGLVPQEFNFNVFGPVDEILMNSAGYHGINRVVAKQRTEHYLRKLDLWGKHRSNARSLSGGMKRRLMIARALVHEPQILILDEPTAGVDIEIRRSMWEFLSEINSEAGTTIILTTHYLEEAEALCRNVAIIDKGQVIEQGKVSELLGQSMVQTFVLDLVSEVENNDIVIDDFECRVLEGKRLEIELPRGHSVNEMFTLLDSAGVKVESMRNKSNRLEEFFLRLMAQNNNADPLHNGHQDAS